MRKLLVSVVLVITVGAIILLTMGLFDRFLKKPVSQEPKNPPPAQGDWAAYVARIEGGHVGSIVVDLSLSSIAPVRERPIRTAIDVTFLSPQENGFPADSEFDKLASIEETLEHDLVSGLGSIYVGHLYAAGKGSIYFYTSDDSKSNAVVRQTMLGFPTYKYEVRTSSDPEWEGYRSLYPSPLEMQLIQNHRLIQSLIDQGDKIEEERQVDHWIYFTTNENRQGFVKEIAVKGFKIEDQREVEATDGKPFQLHISRNDPVTVEATDTYILELWQLAEQFNGTYDGWETFLVRE